MTKILAAVLFVAVGLMTFASPIALARTSSAQSVDQASQAKARNDYLKGQKKQRKNAKKSLKKEQKQWKKQHPKTS
jgi:Tfp pilus assembly protein PilV